MAYENKHRLWLYKQPAGGNALEQPAVVAGAPAGIAKLPRNGGIEAMARLPSGEYLLLSESGVTDDGDRRGWIGRRGKWAELRLAPMGSFEPSDLALLPMEICCCWSGASACWRDSSTRLSLIEGAAVKPGAVLQPREMAILAAPLSVDNFEAVAARQAPDGSTLIYVLSDDNQRMLQRTLLLQFRLTKLIETVRFAIVSSQRGDSLPAMRNIIWQRCCPHSPSRHRRARSPSPQRRCRSTPPITQQTEVDSLQFVAGFELTSPAPEWGGYSGMVMSDDGSRIVAVSDVGHWLRLELTA